MKILIAIPTFDRRIDIEIVKGLINLERNKRYDLDFIFPVSSHLSRNRNLACIEALQSSEDWLLFWDSDIGIEEGFLDKMLETAYKFEAQIVCGAYKTKDPNNNRYVLGIKSKDLRNPYVNLRNISRPQTVDAGGTGIMLIKLEVLKKMADPWFTIIDGKELFVMPEDFEFCRKAQELGFKIVVDPRFETHHWGQWAWKHP